MRARKRDAAQSRTKPRAAEAHACVVAPLIAEDADVGRLTPEPPAREQTQPDALGRLTLTMRIVATGDPLLVCKPPLGPDSVPPAEPGNDALPPNPRRPRSGSKPGDVVVVASDLGSTPDEVEAVAQRLATLLLRAP